MKSTDTLFIWKKLKNNIKKKDKSVIFIWIATCDLTSKSGKYISLTNTEPKFHNKIDNIALQLSTLKAQIEARYKHSKVVILECPSYSISLYNKNKGHPTSKRLHGQTVKLENQIFYLNRQIRKINLQNFKITSKPDKSRKNTDQNNNNQAQDKKTSQYFSPNFTKDVLRPTKFKDQKTKY